MSHKYLVDANFSRKIADFLHSHDLDVIHVSELPLGNKTKDRDINLVSIRESRILITRDHDFVDSYFSSPRPYKLLFISAFTQKESLILDTLEKHITEINRLFDEYGLLELKNGDLIKHT